MLGDDQMKHICHELLKAVDSHWSWKLEKQIDLCLTSYSLQEISWESWKVISPKSFQKRVRQKQAYNDHRFAYHLFVWTGITFDFFQILGKVPLSIKLFKIIDNGSIIDTPQRLIIRNDILPRPCALFIFKALIICRMSSSLKWNGNSFSASVNADEFGMALSFIIGENTSRQSNNSRVAIFLKVWI